MRLITRHKGFDFKIHGLGFATSFYRSEPDDDGCDVGEYEAYLRADLNHPQLVRGARWVLTDNPQPHQPFHLHVGMEAGRGEYRPADYCARLEFVKWNDACIQTFFKGAREGASPISSRVLVGSDDLEYLMLVPVREGGKESEGMLADRITATWASVRLQPLNQCYVVWMNPLKGIRCVVSERFIRIVPHQYRERIPAQSDLWYAPVGNDELPDKVVEGVPDLMDDIAGYDCEPLIHRLRDQAERVDIGFRVVLDGGLCWVVFKVPLRGFNVEGVQCFRSPFETFPAAGEVGHGR